MPDPSPAGDPAPPVRQERKPLRERRKLDPTFKPKEPGPPCRVCERGELEARNMYRLGGCAAFLGAGVGLLGGIVAAIFGLSAWGEVAEGDGSVSIIEAQIILVAVAAAGLCLGGAVLASQRRVLQCSSCGATVPAS